MRVLIAQDQAAEALRLLDGWRVHARAQGRTGSEIEWLSLAALAYQAHGKIEQAVQTLQQALVLAQPAGYVRLFVEEGVPMAALLHRVLARGAGRAGAEYIHSLLLALGEQHPSHPAAVATRQPEPLTGAIKPARAHSAAPAGGWAVQP